MGKKNNIREKRQTGKRTNILGRFVFLLLVLVAISAAFLYWQLKQYEEGILEVCATGQDGYVQLVLDQINLNQNREDEEIITDILGTLDASSNKYWTFSKDQAMLFVKDVTETNKYKGFTTATYYDSDSARKFLTGLQLNRVSHAEIVIDDKEYIASGVVFEYNSNEYRLCLLTNKNVFLDNNGFLGAETELATLMAVLLILLLLVPSFSVRRLQREIHRAEQAEDMVTDLNNRLLELNDALHEKQYFETKNALWGSDTLNVFVEKLKERKITPVTAVLISCKDDEHKQECSSLLASMLDNNVLRFACENSNILLLMLQVNKKAAGETLRNVISGASVAKMKEYEYSEDLSAEELIHMTREDV
ncbi:MAG: hypothetical protein ACI39R_08700 [Lachnospiraceae bacterium]